MVTPFGNRMRKFISLSLWLALLACSGSESALFCDSWGPPSGDSTQCQVRYTGCSDGATYEVNCIKAGGWQCTCRQNNVQTDTFASTNFCDITSGDEQRVATNTGCGFDIGG